MWLPVPPPAGGSETWRDTVRPWALTGLIIPCWSQRWLCSVAVCLCQTETHPWKMDEYPREASPYECSGLPGQTPTCPWPIPAAHGVWDQGAGVVRHHLLHSQPPTLGLQPSLSYVLRGYGGSCARNQPVAQGAMSSLGCILTCQAWAECPWEERREGKQGGIREEVSPGENVLLLLIREKIGCFLSCTSVLSQWAGLYPDQSTPERSGVGE